MSQAHDNYISKKAEYDAATQNVTDLISRLRKFAAPLIANWQTCYIEIFGQGTPMDMIKGETRLMGITFRRPLNCKRPLPRNSLHRERGIRHGLQSLRKSDRS